MAAKQVKKLNVGPAFAGTLAGATKGCQLLTEQVGKHSEKLVSFKEKSTLAQNKVIEYSEMAWTVLGLALLLHGAQFKNLFLCTHVIALFCYGRVKGSTMSLYSDIRAAVEKLDDDDDAPKADAKVEPKKGKNKAGSANNAKDAETAKKVLKALESSKVSASLFELLVAAMACHIVMQGGLARSALLTYILVNACKDKISSLLDFSEYDDMKTWTDMALSFLLYAFFGPLSFVSFSLVFALTLGVVGAQLLTQNGLRIAESKGKIPGGQSAEDFATSLQGFALFGGLAAFGALWQFWALVANSGVAWYFSLIYFPAQIAEGVISIL